RTGGCPSPTSGHPTRDAADLGSIGAVCPAAPGLASRPVHGRAPRRTRSLRVDLLHPHVRHHGGLSPLLRPPLVQDESSVSVPAGLPGLQRPAEGPALVGGSSPPAPS